MDDGGLFSRGDRDVALPDGGGDAAGPCNGGDAVVPSVALLVEMSNAFSRELLLGVRDWMRAHGDWQIHLSEQGRGARPPEWLGQWRGQGIIARVENAAIARAVRACGVPVVNVSAAGLAPEFPLVISDSAEIARLAAEHLRERGLRRFAYCGDARFAWSQRHGENFVKELRAKGFDSVVFPLRHDEGAGSTAERARLRRWLKALPKPCGVMACYDIRAQQVLDACRAAGLRVPDEVAVIGQHNDELLCDLCQPPLSSVIPDARRAGFAAAQLLHELMRKKPRQRRRAAVIEIPPVGVATRASTDTVAVADPRFAAALRWAREHFTEAIGVDDLARVAGMSRSLLERGFRELLGCPPYEHLLRLRMEKARRLLRETDLAVAEVAAQCGFQSAGHFSAAFRQREGVPPVSLRS